MPDNQPWFRRPISPDHAESAGRGDRSWLLLLVMFVLALVGVSGVFVPERSHPPDPIAEAHRLVAAGLPEEAEGVLQPVAQAPPDDEPPQFEWVTCHFQLPERDNNDHPRDDHTIRGWYDSLATSSDSRTVRDVSHLALGLCWSLSGDHERALAAFRQVADTTLPHLNISECVVLGELGLAADAERCFRREIALGRDMGGAVSNLSQLLREQNNWDALRK